MKFPLRALKYENSKLFMMENAPVYSRDIYANYLVKSQKIDVIKQAIHLFPLIKN